MLYLIANTHIDPGCCGVTGHAQIPGDSNPGTTDTSLLTVSARLLRLRTQNTTAAVTVRGKLSLRNAMWAPVTCTDPSIGSRRLTAIIQSC